MATFSSSIDIKGETSSTVNIYYKQTNQRLMGNAHKIFINICRTFIRKQNHLNKIPLETKHNLKMNGVYGVAPQSFLQKLDAIQNLDNHIVLGMFKSFPVSSLQAESSLPSLSHRCCTIFVWTHTKLHLLL